MSATTLPLPDYDHLHATSRSGTLDLAISDTLLAYEKAHANRFTRSCRWWCKQAADETGQPG